MADQLPTGLALNYGLKTTGKYAVGGGGFADVWRGELEGYGDVAIKALRIFSKDPSNLDKTRKVCSVVSMSIFVYNWPSL